MIGLKVGLKKFLLDYPSLSFSVRVVRIESNGEDESSQFQEEKQGKPKPAQVEAVRKQKKIKKANPSSIGSSAQSHDHPPLRDAAAGKASSAP